MFHLDQSLSLALPNMYHDRTEKHVKRNIFIFNCVMIITMTIYFVVFLFLFFTKYDINVQYALAIDLAFRVFLLVIYTVTVIKLFKKFQYLP